MVNTNYSFNASWGQNTNNAMKRCKKKLDDLKELKKSEVSLAWGENTYFTKYMHYKFSLKWP